MPTTDALESDAANSRYAFHSTRRLYHSIAKRLKNHKVFLARNVRKAYECAVEKDTPACPAFRYVIYQSDEPGVEWFEHVSQLRCLWCKRSFIFTHPLQLKLHLQTCHQMLDYTLSDMTKTPLTVKVRLQRDSEPKDNVGDFKNGMFEYTIYQRLQRDKHSKINAIDNKTGPFAAGSSSTHDAPQVATTRRSAAAAERRLSGRPRRSVAPRFLFDDEIISGEQKNGDDKRSASPPPGDARTRKKRQRASSPEIYSGGEDDSEEYQRGGGGGGGGGKGNNRRKQKGKKSRRAREPKGKPAFASVEAAVKNGRLFHSVVHNPLDMEQFGLEGEESENDGEQEEKWRFDLSCEAICDVVDTIAVEKLFMMLWNQYVQLEQKIESDRFYGKACQLFVKTHGIIIRRMRLEATLVRHLNQLARIGLIDANQVFQAIKQLPPHAECKRADGSQWGLDDDDLARFKFAKYVVRQSERTRQRELHKLELENAADKPLPRNEVRE